jgi:hypothetical protein
MAMINPLSLIAALGDLDFHAATRNNASQSGLRSNFDTTPAIVGTHEPPAEWEGEGMHQGAEREVQQQQLCEEKMCYAQPFM